MLNRESYCLSVKLSGQDPEFWVKIIEINVVEINAPLN